MIGPSRWMCCSRHGDASAGSSSTGGYCAHPRSASDIEPEVHDVAFLHQVFLALQAQLAGLARTGFAPAGEVVREGDDFGADEAALEVGMDCPRRLRRGARALPGTDCCGSRSPPRWRRTSPALP